MNKVNVNLNINRSILAVNVNSSVKESDEEVKINQSTNKDVEVADHSFSVKGAKDLANIEMTSRSTPKTNSSYEVNTEKESTEVKSVEKISNIDYIDIIGE